jgi:hypothetical protein
MFFSNVGTLCQENSGNTAADRRAYVQDIMIVIFFSLLAAALFCRHSIIFFIGKLSLCDGE